jgi:hypothetical protein
MDHAPDIADQGVIGRGEFGEAGYQAGWGHKKRMAWRRA